MSNNGNGAAAPRNKAPELGVDMSRLTKRQAVALAREMSYFVNRVAAQRGDLSGAAGKQFGGDRDLYRIFGWKTDPEFDDFFNLYDRDEIAERVIAAPPESTWRDDPELFDGIGDKADSSTQFVTEFDLLAQRLGLFHFCERADVLAGIGEYGVIVIGVAQQAQPDAEEGDEMTLADPVEKAKADEIIYLQVYHENAAKIKQVETDVFSPRYGLPTMYEIDMSGEYTGLDSGRDGTRDKANKVDVHASRVIHIADGLLQNNVFGRPRLRNVFNTVTDLMKVTGAASEAIFKLVYKGFAISTKDGYAMPEDEDEESELQQQIADYVHDLRRFLLLEGFDVNELGGESVDVTAQFDILISRISGKTRIPRRILLGSEVGQLASAQDAANYATYIGSRRVKYAEAIILKQIVDRFIEWEAIPAPTNKSYSWQWTPLFSLDDVQRSQVALNYADAFDKLSGGMSLAIIGASEFRSEFTPLGAEPSDDLLLDLLIKEDNDPA